jgi:hypothetical protein
VVTEIRLLEDSCVTLAMEARTNDFLERIRRVADLEESPRGRECQRRTEDSELEISTRGCGLG